MALNNTKTCRQNTIRRPNCCLYLFSGTCRFCMYKSSEAEQKKEILDWIEAVIGEKINKSDAFEKVLKDGVILCKYVSCLQSRNDSLFCGVNRFYRCKQMYNVGLHYIPDHVCWRLAKSHFVFQFVQFPALGLPCPTPKYRAPKNM